MSATALTTHSDQLLRRVLRANAIFSGASGLLLVLGFNPLAAVIGVPWAWSLLVIGIGLLGYAFLLARASRRPALVSAEAMLFVAADSAWVVLSVFLLATNWVPFTEIGKWLIALSAMVVGCFALLQYIGQGRLERTH